MNTKRRDKLTYANVMATIAVFIALGGASYAALKLPKNSVGTKQIKKNAVTTSKIKKEAITAAKVKKGTLTGSNVQDGSLTGSEIQDGSLTGADINQGSLNDVRAANVMSLAISKDENCSPVLPPPAGVTTNRAATGRCVITFPNSVANCTATAGIHFRPGKLELIVLTDRSTQLFSSSDEHKLGVETYEGESLRNLPFDVTIIC